MANFKYYNYDPIVVDIESKWKYLYIFIDKFTKKIFLDSYNILFVSFIPHIL